MKATGPNTETYSRVFWDASDYVGEEVYIEIVDKQTGPMGHLNVDDFHVYNRSREDIIDELKNPGFETGDLMTWERVDGDAFKVTDLNFPPEAKYHLTSSFDRGKTGVIKSHEFELAGTGEISFYIKTDQVNSDNLYCALVRASDDKVICKATGNGRGTYTLNHWDALKYLGEEVYLKIVDNSITGYISVDGFITKKQGLIGHWGFERDEETYVKYLTGDKGVKLKPIAIDYASGKKDEISYVFNDARYKPSSPPLWREGVVGDALLFDGYSTWLSRPAGDIPYPVSELTIEAWVAPRSYEWGDGKQLSAIVNHHNKFKMTGYILGIYRHGSWSFQVGTGREWIDLWSDNDKPLVKGKWSHVAAVFDGNNRVMKLYLNGELVGQKRLKKKCSIAPCKDEFRIGKNNQAISIGPFTVNMFSGMMDEVKVYNQALSGGEIISHYREVLAEHNGKLPEPDLELERSRYAGDRYRPQYHFIPPAHWMNEPHAPFYYDPDPTDDTPGKYHLFYQHNPQGPFWHQIHWGHAVSDDMVHWEDMPIAIAPQEPVTPDGVWSGDAVIDRDGKPVLFFTAGDDERGRSSNKTNQNVGLARASNPLDPELKDWEVFTELVAEQTRYIANMNALSFDHFRDPFVWRDDKTGDYYMLVGTGLVGRLGGTATLFKATDDSLEDWECIGNLYEGDPEKYPIVGHVWELPVLLPLRDQDGNKTDKYILLINPWFATPSPYAVKFVPYWIGTLKRNSEGVITRFEPGHEEPRLFDYGENFTGPSGFVAPDGRSILFTIAQGKRTPRQHYDSGWAHNAGLPLSLYLDMSGNGDYHLKIKPIRELESLRQQKLISINNKTLAEANQMLATVGGDMLEIKLELDASDAEQYGIKVRRSPGGEEETIIYYDAVKETLNINRNKSSRLRDVSKGIQGGELKLHGAHLYLHIFLDRSMVEVYANNLKSLTSRVYPTRSDAIGLQLFSSNGNITVKKMEVWEMGSAYTEDGKVAPAYFGN